MGEFFSGNLLVLLAIFGTGFFLWVAVERFFTVRRLAGGLPNFRETSLPPDDSDLPESMVDIAAILREAGFRHIMREKVKSNPLAGSTLHYMYLNAEGTVNAELLAPNTLLFISRFNDDSVLITTYPVGHMIETERQTAQYAAHDPAHALDHHLAALAASAAQRGGAVVMRTAEDISAMGMWYRKTHGPIILSGLIRVLRAMSWAYLACFAFFALVLINYFVNEAFMPLDLAVSLTFLVPIAESHLVRWNLRGKDALDEALATVVRTDEDPLTRKGKRREQNRRYRPVRLVWVAVLGLVMVVGVFTTPSILGDSNGFGASLGLMEVHLYENGSVSPLPLPGAQIRDMAMDDSGAIWAVTDGALLVWNGTDWQRLYAVDWGADIAIDGDDVWAADNTGIVRCAAAARTCQAVHGLGNPISVAAANGRMLALNRDGMAVSYEDGVFTDFMLEDFLVGIDMGDFARFNAEAMLLDDGTALIHWGKIWRERADGRWRAEDFGGDEAIAVNLIGATPSSYWLVWRNGISEISTRSGSAEDEFYEWPDIGGEQYANVIFDVDATPNGTAWFGTTDGLLLFQGGTFQPIPILAGQRVLNVAVGSSGRIGLVATTTGTTVDPELASLLFSCALPLALPIAILLLLRKASRT